MSASLTTCELEIDLDESVEPDAMTEHHTTFRPSMGRRMQRFTEGSDRSAGDLRVFDQSGRIVTRHALTRPTALVGRCPKSDLYLADEAISYRHVWLQLLGGRLLAVDLHSRTGTEWADGRRRFGWVGSGESLQIGPYRIEYRAADIESDAGDISPPEADDLFLLRTSPSQLMLEPLGGARSAEGEPPKLLPIRRNINLIGSGERCRIRLQHSQVSRVHCALMWLEGELWVVDLLGKRGTRVDGKRVKLERLTADSVLQVGPFRFALREGAESTCFAAAEPASDHAFPILSTGAWSRAGDRPPPPSSYFTGGVSEQFVAWMMDRFLVMHQEMMSHSQQQMLMMAQLMGAMHENQLDLVRDDLQRVHEIMQEMQQLQTALVKDSVAQTEVRSDGASELESTLVSMLFGALLQSSSSAETTSQTREPTADGADLAVSQIDDPHAPPARQSVPGRGSAESAGGDGQLDATSPLSDTRAATNPASTPDESHNASNEGEPLDPSGVLDADPVSTTRPEGGDSDRSRVPPQVPPLQEETRQPPLGIDSGAGIRTENDIEHHIWLTERMRKLERERNSRLKKILRVLTGHKR